MAGLPDRIKELRKHAGLTQKEFGQLFGLAKNTISQYENGSHAPNDDIKIAIANHFHISMDYLMGKTNNPETDSSTPSVFASQITNAGIKAIHAYAALSPKNQKRVEDYIQMLVEWEAAYGEKLKKPRQGKEAT